MSKLCECGCGQPAPISPYSSAPLGYRKGEPRRFVRGHQVRVYDTSGSLNPHWRGGVSVSRGYVRLHRPDHPRVAKNGYVPEQVLVAEAALGKYLPPKAIVHHVNQNRGDNRNANLVVCENTAYHNLIHQRMRALAACGHAGWRLCDLCGQYDDLANLYLRKKTNDAVHRACANTSARKYYARRKSVA